MRVLNDILDTVIAAAIVIVIGCFMWNYCESNDIHVMTKTYEIRETQLMGTTISKEYATVDLLTGEIINTYTEY